MKKRIALVAAVLGAIVLAVAGVATAGGNGTQATPYKASYNDYVFGPVSCSGVHQIKKDGSVQDSFTCASTSGKPLTYGTPGQTFTWGGGTWMSDYNQAMATGLNGTISADAMSYSGVATY